MFISALFTITKIWKPPKCPLTDKWRKKMWYTHTPHTHTRLVFYGSLIVTFCFFSFTKGSLIHSTHICLFIYFWLRWGLRCCAGFLQLQRAGATLRCSVRASHCGGFSCCGAQALDARASVVVAHGLSCSTACGILPDQGSNPCLLHWQADSQPLRHQGSPQHTFIEYYYVRFSFFFF